MPHKPAESLLDVPSQPYNKLSLRDVVRCVSCDLKATDNESHQSHLCLPCSMLHHIQGSNSSLWLRVQTSVRCTTVHMVRSFLCVNALKLASTWCLEQDFVRLQKVSRNWYRAFEYVPDEVVQTRIESQHSTYFAQMVALQWVRRWTQYEW